uniref:Carboxylic ester hydrolase n=1 Tax=Gopherus evgoodei TaxID=1825980 RepID=A0A8C4WSB8_9SAUR
MHKHLKHLETCQVILNLSMYNLIVRICFTGQNAAPPEVVTKYGKLQGQRIKVDGAETHVDVFLGIPFAKPPVGPLRFSPPVPPEPWKGLRNATIYPPMCLQDSVAGQHLSDAFTNRKEKLSFQVSEDCLFLNVYTPASSDKDMLPVMVWIHGGALVIGAASTYDGSALSAFENVVVVTVQYRLGILGYFSSGDEHARGNWGYLDQVAALQWIQENIEHFGGDPGSVTIFGESAGGFSVSALVLSPLAKGLFHKAISESGVTIKIFFTAHPEAQKIAKVSGCQSSSSAAMVHCLREKTEEEMMEITLKMVVLDGVFFLKSPEELLAEKAINAVPYIIGVNNHEFGWLLPNVSDCNSFIYSPLLQRILSWHVPAEFTYLLTNEYLSNIEEPTQLRDRLFELMGDAMFVVPSIQTARYHRGDATEEEGKLSKTIMKYWANFARKGNPNGEGLMTWPVYNVDEQYLIIDIKQKAAKKLKENRVEFWTKTLP